ncbi:hypothetical protein [Clostridium aceticum]|nr:hypothetical protein [Clostridium aceticum]
MTMDNLCSVIVIAMEVLMYINLLRLFLKISKKQYLKLYFFVFISSVIIVTTHSIIQYSYNLKTVIVLIIHGLMIIAVLKTTVFKTIFLSLIYAVVTLLGNVFAIFIMRHTLGAEVVEILNEPRLFFAGNIVSFSVIGLLLYSIKYILLYKAYGKMVRSKAKNIILYILTVFSMLFINYYTFIYHVNKMNVWISVLHFILVGVYIMISLDYTFLEKNFYYQKILYQNQQEYLTKTESLLNDYRELKHGWKDYLTGFSGFIYGGEKDWEALVAYYESVVEKTKDLSKDSLS